VALSCTGAPQYATCSLNPASIAITGLNSSSVTASIATGVSTSTSSALRHNPLWKSLLPVLALALPLGFAGLRRGRSAQTMLLLAIIVLTVAGCGVAASGGSEEVVGVAEAEEVAGAVADPEPNPVRDLHHHHYGHDVQHHHSVPVTLTVQ